MEQTNEQNEPTTEAAHPLTVLVNSHTAPVNLGTIGRTLHQAMPGRSVIRTDVLAELLVRVKGLEAFFRQYLSVGVSPPLDAALEAIERFAHLANDEVPVDVTGVSDAVLRRLARAVPSKAMDCIASWIYQVEADTSRDADPRGKHALIAELEAQFATRFAEYLTWRYQRNAGRGATDMLEDCLKRRRRWAPVSEPAEEGFEMAEKGSESW